MQAYVFQVVVKVSKRSDGTWTGAIISRRRYLSKDKVTDFGNVFGPNKIKGMSIFSKEKLFFFLRRHL